MFYKTQAAADGSGREAVLIDGNYVKAEKTLLSVIGTSAFAGCKSLKKFDIPSDVNTIEAYAFSGAGLTEITIPNSVTMLESYIFYGCVDLKKATVKSNIMGDYMFRYCTALYDVTISEEVTTIPTYAFAGCTSLKQIGLPQNLKSIKMDAFNASGLEEIVIGSQVSEINRNAFANNKNLASVTFEENYVLVRFVGYSSKAFSGCTALTDVDLRPLKACTYLGINTFAESGITSIYLPENVEHIGNTQDKPPALKDKTTQVFYNCKRLTTVYLPNKLQTIGGQVFFGCESLKKVVYDGYTGNSDFVLPSGLRLIAQEVFAGSGLVYADISAVANSANLGTGIFKDCTNLKEVALNTGITKLPDEMFSGCTSLENFDFAAFGKLSEIGAKVFQNTAIKSAELRSGIAKVGANVFDGSKLTNVLISDSLSKLGDAMFANCKLLTEVVLPSNLFDMGNNTFENSGIVSITIPQWVYSIGKGVFMNCSDLSSVTVKNDKLTSIGSQAFKGCVNLEKFVIGQTVLNVGNAAFAGCVKLNLTVAEGNDNYSVTSDGLLIDSKNTLVSVYGNSTEVNLSGIAAIANGAFDGNTTIRRVTIPAVMESIGDNTFKDCTALASVIFENGSKLEKIGAFAFSNSGITDITIPKTVKTIGGNAFKGCKSLATVNFDDTGNVVIGNNAFAETGITKLSIKDNFASIGKMAFSDNTALKKVEINAKTTFDKDVFKNSTGIETIIIGDKTTLLTEGMFMGCTGLKNVTLGANLMEIGVNTFAGCSQLQEITIPDSVVNIKEKAFENCTSLSSVVLNETSNLAIIGKSIYNTSATFRNTALKSFYVPAKTRIIGMNVFEGCTKLEKVEFAKRNELLSLYSGAFAYCTAISSIVIDKNIKIDGNSVFYGWTDKQTINIVGRNEYDIINSWGGTIGNPSISEENGKAYSFDSVAVSLDGVAVARR